MQTLARQALKYGVASAAFIGGAVIVAVPLVALADFADEVWARKGRPMYLKFLEDTFGPAPQPPQSDPFQDAMRDRREA